MEVIDYDSQKHLEDLREQSEEQIKVATALAIMKSTDGWKIILDTFEDMKQNQLDVLAKQRPGDEKSILAAHAVWAATVHTLDQIVEAIDTQIRLGEESRQLLESLKYRQVEDEI